MNTSDMNDSNIDPSEIPERADVVVIGGGLAGHCAALAAAEQGARVVLLEKTVQHGGSSAQSGGSFAFSNTDDQRAAGVEDSDELFERDLLQASGGKADPALIRRYLALQHDTQDWLRRHGVVFHKVSLSSNTSVPRTHPTNPQQLMDALNHSVRNDPRITYVPHATALSLIVEGRRSVRGVVADYGGREVRIRAARGVVLASGGFSKNRELIGRHAPELLAAPMWGGAGNTGDGLAMATGLGADVRDMEFVTGTFGMAINRYPAIDVAPDDEPFLRMAIYRGAVVVNLEGQRFADESISYKTLGTLCLRQPKGVAFQIFDQPIMDQSVPEPTVNDFHGALEHGVIKRADTLRELAGLVGLDPDRLEATIARYNRDVDQGRDSEFGRTHLGKNWGQLVRIETPPFYILPCSTGVLATYCGLRVDADTRVLDTQGEAIAGLFAAGEVTGGFHGPGYVSGTALGKAAIFGRLAGSMAASVPSDAA